jgi:predicted RNA binding protein YcfA (HicA-like mRNA interferase family)
MPILGPVKRNELIRNLKKLGFEGPLAGGNHQYMIRSNLKLHIPNPHSGDISKGL